jgi:hypothetical protein
MARTNHTARLAPYAAELLENAYVQENLRDGVEKLRAAYQRAQKRRVEPTRDEKLRQQLRSAAASISEAGRALGGRRRKPEPRWGRRLALIAAVGAAGAIAGLAARERLAKSSGPEPADPMRAQEPAARVSEPATA